MRQTLFYIPERLDGLFGLPLFGLGLLLIVWLAFSVLLMVWLVRRQGWNDGWIVEIERQLFAAVLDQEVRRIRRVERKAGIQQGVSNFRPECPTLTLGEGAVRNYFEVDVLRHALGDAVCATERRATAEDQARVAIEPTEGGQGPSDVEVLFHEGNVRKTEGLLDLSQQIGSQFNGHTPAC